MVTGAEACGEHGIGRSRTGVDSSSGSGSTSAGPRGSTFSRSLVEFPPYGVGGFSDSCLLHQFARHRAHQVFIGVERLQTFARELAFHHQGHQHLLAHQPEAGLLHRARVRDELHPHRESLPDAPRSSASLAQRVQASSLSRRSRVSETPAGPNPSRPAWDGR